MCLVVQSTTITTLRQGRGWPGRKVRPPGAELCEASKRPRADSLAGGGLIHALEPTAPPARRCLAPVASATAANPVSVRPCLRP